MRVPLKWLQEFVDIDVSAEKLGELLDLSGTKVESVVRPSAGVEGVVVAEVTEIREHPNADNLTLVDARVSDGEIHHVVCGARNFKVGDRVPLARVGARLGVGDETLEITERKIRGESSRGMLCSGSELGISKDHSGILVLPPDAPLGSPITELLGLDDAIMEFEITSNRPDCLSVIGIAREVSVVLGNELKPPDIAPAPSGDGSVKVQIEDASRCPRYLARVVDQISVGPSPAWLASRLLSAGVRPISNVVDVTNYVMLEYGQPLHAFDATQVHQGTIVVRTARRGERIRTLDGSERDLYADDLLITDPRRPLAIAGVMGGEESEVGETTASCIIESAYFSKATVAFTARRHGLRTEASARFERGTDPNGVHVAAERAARLIEELAGGAAAPSSTDVYPSPVERRRVVLNPARTGKILGAGLTTDQQTGYLRGLGMGVRQDADVLEVEVPTFRPDVVIEEDLIEEVGRLAGFERLPATLPPGRTGGLDRSQRFLRWARAFFTDTGVAEAWNTSLMRAGEIDALGLPQDHAARSAAALANPMSDEETALRTSLLPGLLRSVSRNAAQRADSIALFELARVFEASDAELPLQPLLLGAAFSGERVPTGWNAAGVAWDLFAAKGVLESLCRSAGIPDLGFEPAEGMPFHPTRAASVTLEGRPIGSLGQLHPDVCARFSVPDPTICFEIAAQPLIDALPGREKVTDLSRYPAAFIDIAVVLDADTPAEAVRRVIEEAGRPELTHVRLFDLYQGDQIEPGKKSLAFSLALQVPDRTLTDEETLAVRDRIVAALQDSFQAVLRA